MKPLTLNRALALYLDHAPDLSASRKRALPLAVRNWRRFKGPVDVRAIKSEHFVSVRRAAHTAGLSPHTIETMLSAILSLIRHCGPRDNRCPHGLTLIREVPYIGKRLRLTSQLRAPAPMESLSACYEIAGSSEYAPWESGYFPRDFWRAFLVLSYNTGLRFGDLAALRWTDCDFAHGMITVRASKTKKVQHLPINATLAAHLARLPRHTERVLSMTPGVGTYVNQKLHELCDLAGCEHFTPQGIRRRAACEYERVHPGAGSLLLGHSLPGASSITWQHYVSALDVVLRPASEKIPQPWPGFVLPKKHGGN